MGEVNYAPLIDDMVWSYSRIKAFEDCPYRWYLKYIKKFHGKDMFFSSYGTFMHKLIELCFKLDIENPIIRINTAFKGCSSLEKISVLPRIYHN